MKALWTVVILEGIAIVFMFFYFIVSINSYNAKLDSSLAQNKLELQNAAAEYDLKVQKSLNDYQSQITKAIDDARAGK